MLRRPELTCPARAPGQCLAEACWSLCFVTGLGCYLLSYNPKPASNMPSLSGIARDLATLLLLPMEARTLESVRQVSIS